ncbi:MAG TPA: nucleoside recognition domain-containing protein [Rhodothermales bacterium]|nr:nucleoside recognition domain-containing protein [Rhodothermales bacterium]
MLNYISAGLIVVSFAFALYYDGRDLARDTYANGHALGVQVAFPDGYDAEARGQDVEARFDPVAFQALYDVEADTAAFPAELIRTDEGTQLRWAADAELPEPLATVATHTNPRDEVLQGETAAFGAVPAGARVVRTAVRFEPVRFVKLQAISGAALEFATTAAELAIGLIGVLALFLGLLRIAEAAGIIGAMARVVEPLLRPLFPDIPKGHPAYSLIVMNLAANVMGLGNAATPFGIKAMEELQKLNPEKSTATNPMVMLLVMNTASVQLVPPVLLIALMGLQINQLIFAIILATGLSLVIAVTLAKLFERIPRFRASDPARLKGGAAPADFE